MEPVEGAAILDKLAALLLEHVPDGALRLVDMAMGFGVGDALVEQPGVQPVSYTHLDVYKRQPLHSDPPTARAIYATVRIGQPILPEHYRAVAAAIRFAEAMRKRHKGMLK